MLHPRRASRTLAAQCPALSTEPFCPHLVVQRELTESRDVLGPLHQYQQLLLHGLTHVCNVGNLLGPNVTIDSGDRGSDLQETRSAVAGSSPSPVSCMRPAPQKVSLCVLLALEGSSLETREDPKMREGVPYGLLLPLPSPPAPKNPGALVPSEAKITTPIL